MKTMRQRLPLPLPPQLLHRQIPAIHSPSSSSSSSSSSSVSISDSSTSATLTSNTNTALSETDLSKLNLLLPRLCLYNHHSTAIALLDAALLSHPPLRSLPLRILSHSLSSQPDFALTMSLLTRLHHHRNSLLYSPPIASLLLFSYSKRRKSREALKIFHWMLRPGSPCEPDDRLCKTLIAGLCRKGMTLEVLRVLRTMIDFNLVVDCDLRSWVFRALLREAMIGEALEINQSLDCGGDLRKAAELLDRVIADWVE